MTEEAIMTDEQLQRIHDIEYSCDSRAELAERIVGLEDELAKWERLTAGVELPDYPITEFQPKDLERENAKLIAKLNAEHIVRQNVEVENVKLRELVCELWEGYQDPPCEDCPYKDTPTCADCSICAREAAVIDCMRELGIEVDG